MAFRLQTVSIMKSLLLFFILASSLKAYSSPSKCKISLSPSTVTEEQVSSLIGKLMQHYADDFKKLKIDPMPMFDYENKGWDARVKFDGMFHNIYLTGGMVQYHGMTIDTAVLVIVHELGHLLGKGPKLVPHSTSVEGEADYMSGLIFRKMAELGLLPENSVDKNSELYTETKKYMAAQGIQDPNFLELATRLGIAAQQLNKIQFNMLAEISKKPESDYNVSLSTPDKTMVEKTLDFYPSDQSRLDSIIAGFLGKPRPRSWANPADFQ